MYFRINVLCIIISLFQSSKTYVVLPFKTTKILPNNIISKNENHIEQFLQIINNSKIYASISCGIPPNTIDFLFSMNQYITSISKNNYQNNFYNKNSEYFNKINDELYIEKCSIYNDLNLTENITINSLLFYSDENENKDFIQERNNDNRYCGVIGLSRYPLNSNYNFKSFIYNLKNNNYINSYSFGFFFFEDQQKIKDDKEDIYDGFFIAGITPDDNIDIFETNLMSNAYAEEGSLNWVINFERIFYYENINDSLEYIEINNTKVEFIIDLNYIISDAEYYQGIKKYFFQKFFDNNTCSEEKSINNNEFIYMIICNLNFKDNMKKFPSLYLYREQLFLAFNLNYEDLFFEYNNKIYFLIIRKEHIINHWQIGKIFLKKYPLIFDYDKKIVSYAYLKKHWNPIKSNKINNNNKIMKDKIIKRKNINKDIILYILIIIGIVIGIFIGKIIWNKNKKLKANELEENFKYLNNENINDKSTILI